MFPFALTNKLAKAGERWQNRGMLRCRQIAVLILLTLVGMMGCQQNPYLRTPRGYKFTPASQALVPRTMSRLAQECNIKVRLMSPKSRPRRAAKRMRPTFITIHSTANHSRSATALQHSRALTNGSITNRSWHFTADQYMVVQNLPLNETAWHAGTAAGNHNSIGIEMCEAESLGHNHYRTWNRAAKLTAVLMKRYRINLRHVVPHYHWTRKNCPAPLMTNGRPGPKWAWFLSRIDYYYRCINNGKPNR